MKHLFKYITTMVALLAMTVGTWADNERVNITILPETQTAAPGMVDYNIEGKKCTLTVTPSQGYSCSLENVYVELTVNGDLAQTPRRSPEIQNVTVTAETPNADPSGTTQYSFEFPDDTYNAEVVVVFQKIGLYVGGVGVTSYNASRITGANITGIVSFNATTNTLTLNGATIDMSNAQSGFPIESYIDDLKVYLVGANTLKPNATSAFGFEYRNSADEGYLTFTHQDSPGKNGYGSLSIIGGTITSMYEITNNFITSTENGWINTENSFVTYVEYYDLYIGSKQVVSTELTLFGGKVFFNPVTKTLSLNNYITSENITSGLSELTVALTGVNEVGKILFSNMQQLPAAGTITISKAATSDADLNKLTASVEDFGSVTVEEPLHAIQPNVFSDVVDYNLYINGTRVNSENKNNITTGVSFDGDQTLTLYNVDTTLQKGAFIKNGLNKLTINVLGENTVDCGNEFSFLEKVEGDNDHELTFTTDVNGAGSLTVTLNAENNWFDGHNTPTYLNNLRFNSSITEGIQTIIVAAPSAYYGLKIGNTEVTNLNAANVMPGVSFDATLNTLTLNAASITGNIEISRSELNIYLIGTSTMTGGFTLAEGSAGGKLTFASGGNAIDKLTMGAPFATGFNIFYSNKLQLNGSTISLPDYYGITVAGIDITPTNRTDVLVDGTVAFDGNAKLILTNANIIGKIVVTPEAQLPEGGLTIELVGHSKITNNEGVAVQYTDSKLNVTFITVSNESVSLVYTNTNDDPSTVAPTLATAFSNCDVLFDEVLASAENTTDKTVTICPALELVVTETNPVAQLTFSVDMDESTNTNNNVIEGFLYTMGDETGNNATTNGGYDQYTGQVVFTENSVMTQDDLDNITGQPGSPEYANEYIGITAMLPPGDHTLELLDVVIAPQYDLAVKIGDQEELRVRKILGTLDLSVEVTNEDVTIPIYTQETATLQIYLTKPTASDADYSNFVSGAPAMMASHRIGPKASVSGGLGGLKVTNNSMQSPEPPATSYKAMEVSAVHAAMGSISDAFNGFTCSDPDITDLPDDMFVDNSPSSAPRRAGGVKTILPENLTYVDFSGTKITGMEVDRTKGAFNGVPENIFIYMPAGNTAAAGSKNVVIGGISDVVELDGSIDAQPFKAMKDFKAAQVTLKREFEAGGADKKATIYLPYDIPQAEANEFGTFYQYDGNDGTTVSMIKVTTGGLKANKPYIFEAKEGGITDPMVRTTDVKANPAETEGFKGVYERKDYEPGMYCYAAETRSGYTIGQFAEMGPGSYVPPFRAYMIGSGVPSYAIAWDGVIDEFENVTAIETIETKKTVASEKTSEGWWTLSGMRLTDMPKKAGLYIFNGKMVVVK